MTLLQVGDKAPLFRLPNQDNTEIKLADLLGRFVVIYFYPKAMTPGCTTQACGIRDNWGKLQQADVTVLGVSPDAPKLLKKFKDVENLPFDLLSDSNHSVADAYGTWQEKSMYGRTYMGMARDSFILGPNGTLIGVLHKVKPAEHVDEVLGIIHGYLGSRT